MRPAILFSFGLVWALATMAPSSAAAAPGDPSVGSPAGTVYELPFEKGRKDAAPKGGGGSTEAGTGSSAEAGEDVSSLYRSENNFGSSSRVPGSTAAAAGAEGAGSAAGELAAGADSGSPSAARSYALLALIALAGVGIALAARRHQRSDQ